MISDERRLTVANKTTFPVSTGLLSQKHRDAISSAIWEFLWLIDRTTREHEEDGCSWGVVLGGKPIQAAEIAEDFNMHPETVKKNLRRLEKGHYIKTTRTRYGLVIYVRKSIKFVHRQNKQQKVKPLPAQKLQPEDIPNNQQIIAELVSKYRDIPGMLNQQGDYPFIGRMYNQYGYDHVLDCINNLALKMARGFKPDDPLLYLSGILRGGSGNGANSGYSGGKNKAAATGGRPGCQPSAADWSSEGDRI